MRLTVDTAAKDEHPAVANLSVGAVGVRFESLASVIHVRDKLTYCVVEGKKCQSLHEWDAAAGPLMKE